MSFFDRTKEFFGLQPMDLESMEQDDAYYSQDRVEEPGPVRSHGRVEPENRRRSSYDSAGSAGSAAYAPRAYESEEPLRDFGPTIVPVSLASYKEAMKIAQPFLDGDAVVFELTDADKSNSRRLIDFSAGLVLAGKGKMKNVTQRLDTDRLVFAILPEGCTVSASELERAAGLR